MRTVKANMWRKMFLLLLAMAFCLGACGGNTDEVTQTDEQEDEVAVEEAEEEEEYHFLGDYTIQYFQSGPLILVIDNKADRYSLGAMDETGKIVIPCKYDSL